MEKQSKLREIEAKEAIEEAVKPEIKVIRNTFMMAGGIVKEEVIIKRWILNHLRMKEASQYS